VLVVIIVIILHKIYIYIYQNIVLNETVMLIKILTKHDIQKTKLNQ